jgi:hypothetical protein
MNKFSDGGLQRLQAKLIFPKRLEAVSPVTKTHSRPVYDIEVTPNVKCPSACFVLDTSQSFTPFHKGYLLGGGKMLSAVIC